MARRVILLPSQATTEGARLLRELLRRMTAGAIARKLRCDERAIRTWAREDGKPSLIMRGRAREAFGIVETAWDDPAVRDAYAGSEPATTRRT